MLIVWQFEQCPYCKKVREALTERRVDYVAVNAPDEAEEKDAVLRKLFDSVKVPALWDTQTGDLRQLPEPCLDYIRSRYGKQAPA